jgi:hypothetical protein
MMHQTILELFGKNVGCLAYIADKCGGHKKELMQHIITKKRIYDRLKVGLYPKPKKLPMAKLGIDK